MTVVNHPHNDLQHRKSVLKHTHAAIQAGQLLTSGTFKQMRILAQTKNCFVVSLDNIQGA